MKREFSEWPCSVARAVEVFGDSWTILIYRDAAQGLSRFDEFQQSLNIARNTLSDRLAKLVEAGVMTKRFYQDNPPRYEYVLTEMGRDFFPALATIRAWGDKWLDGGAGAPITLHHHPYGHDLASQVVCAECGELVVHEDIEFRMGPGYPEDVRPELDIRARLAPASHDKGCPTPTSNEVATKVAKKVAAKRAASVSAQPKVKKQPAKATRSTVTKKRAS